MDERAYVERRRPEWERLVEILGKASSGGLKSLTNAELVDLGKLYRRVTSDLAFAKANSINEDLVVYLNELAGRAHGFLYADAPRDTTRSIRSFLLRGFPILFREKRRFIAMAAAIMILSSIFAAVVVTISPSTSNLIIPRSFRGGEHSSGPREHMANPSPLAFSSMLMTNNIKVSLGAFAGGVTFGLLTVYMLIYNGLILGAFLGNPPPGLRDPLDWCAYIFPHGVIELTAICIAGGAGLILGWSLIAPGNLSRWDSLRKSSRDALPLIGGVVAMLIIAGFIESCVARSTLPRGLKLSVAVVTAVGLIAYFGLGGRGKSRNQGTQVM